MPEADDIQLLRDYAERQSEAAFAGLVQRHLNLVYSVALRYTSNPHQAEEITQAVFLILARKAGTLHHGTVLSGWLYQTARLTAANLLRGERRRIRREQGAYMQSLENNPAPESWRQIQPWLDDAMAELGDTDRTAVVLRFFEDRSLREVGDLLGTSEDAAKMRVHRALEQLRGFFARRGVALPATTVGSLLAAHAVQAAPPAMFASVMAAGGGAVVTASTLSLAKGVLELVTLTKLKLSVISAVIVVGVATPLVLQQQTNSRLRDENDALRRQLAQSMEVVAAQVAQPERDAELARAERERSELLRLRNDVSRLREQEQELARLRAANRVSANPSSKPPTAQPTELPRDSWTDAGFATPETVLQTRGWAVVNGNRERFKESMHITEEARQILGSLQEHMIAGAPDPAAARRQIEENGLGLEDALLFPMIAENQQRSYTSYRVIGQHTPSANERIVEIETTMAAGEPRQETLKLQRFGNEWKVVLDAEVVRALLK